VVFVVLAGSGDRREMVLDAERWPSVVSRWGSSWLPLSGRTAREAYVGKGQTVAGKTRIVRLSRLLTRAAAGQRVCFRNGDHLDLRRSNLLVGRRSVGKPRRPRPKAAAALVSTPPVTTPPNSTPPVASLETAQASLQASLETTQASLQASLQRPQASLPRHRGPRLLYPVVRYGILDGHAVVYVPLGGAGYGREMLLDAERWPMVADCGGRLG
jgi:hypothetical protein